MSGKTSQSNARSYIRHPAHIPVRLTVADHLPRRQQAQDISIGGLALCWPEDIERGAAVEVQIDSVHPPFDAFGRVAWHRHEGNHYLIGIEFLTQEDAFRARMVEQICHIEAYREQVLKTEKRELDSEQAAWEWLEKYAGQFPTDAGDAQAEGE